MDGIISQIASDLFKKYYNIFDDWAPQWMQFYLLVLYYPSYGQLSFFKLQGGILQEIL